MYVMIILMCDNIIINVILLVIINVYVWIIIND